MQGALTLAPRLLCVTTRRAQRLPCAAAPLHCCSNASAVDAWSNADSSGRLHWRLAAAAQPGLFSIEVRGGRYHTLHSACFSNLAWNPASPLLTHLHQPHVHAMLCVQFMIPSLAACSERFLSASAACAATVAGAAAAPRRRVYLGSASAATPWALRCVASGRPGSQNCTISLLVRRPTTALRSLHPYESLSNAHTCLPVLVLPPTPAAAARPRRSSPSAATAAAAPPSTWACWQTAPSQCWACLQRPTVLRW